jgi:hypothetical protein
VGSMFERASYTRTFAPAQLRTKHQPHTREWVFDTIKAWCQDHDHASNAFLVTGVAGTGKSVVAAQLCVRGSPDFVNLGKWNDIGIVCN